MTQTNRSVTAGIKLAITKYDMDLISQNLTNDGSMYAHFRSEAELQMGVLMAKIVYPVLLVAGTIGNLLSVIVFSRKNMRKSTTNIYLLALSIADLIFLYASLTREWIVYAFNYDIRTANKWTCKLQYWLYYVTSDFSVWILTTVTIVRMMSIFKPVSRKTRFFKRRARLVFVCLFLFSAMLHSHFLFGIELQKNTWSKTKEYTCGIGTRLYHIFINHVWHYIDLFAFSLIPFFILSVSNISIIVRVVSKNRKINRQLAASSSSLSKERISSMTKLLLILNVVFIICTAPICVYLIGMKYWIPADVPKRIQEQDPWWVGVNLLMYINSAFNFFLYSLSGSRFRQELQRLFSWKAKLEPSVALHANRTDGANTSIGSATKLFTDSSKNTN